MPEVSDSTERRELPKVEPVTGEVEIVGYTVQLSKLKTYLVAMRLRETPVPIPNTMVKT